MPATPAPMLSGPAVAAMYPFVPVSITPDGFPRSPPDPREQEDDRRGSLSRRLSLRGPGAEASKRPPRDWRSDFSMDGPGLPGNFLTRSRSKPSVSGGHGTTDFLQPKVTLNAYIRYVSNKPPTHLESPAPTPVSRPPLGAHVVDGPEILLDEALYTVMSYLCIRRRTYYSSLRTPVLCQTNKVPRKTPHCTLGEHSFRAAAALNEHTTRVYDRWLIFCSILAVEVTLHTPPSFSQDETSIRMSAE
ncbi:hypothetical protein VTO73DRAFT_10235 [Trametes versicolor]